MKRFFKQLAVGFFKLLGRASREFLTTNISYRNDEELEAKRRLDDPLKKIHWSLGYIIC